MASFSINTVSRYLARAGEVSKATVSQKDPVNDKIRFSICSGEDENERKVFALFRDEFNKVATSNAEFGFEVDLGSLAVVTTLYSKKLDKRITIYHDQMYEYIAVAG